MTCSLCPGVCVDADLSPLLANELRWLWDTVAHVADHRGDDTMTKGALIVVAPAEAGERAAVAGLVGGRPLLAGQTRRVDLAELTAALTVVGPELTPGAVAAHAVGRRLATRVRQREARDAATAAIREHLRKGLASLSSLGLEPDEVVGRLSRTGWVARIRNTTNSEDLVASALAVLSRLPEPGLRVDRRTLIPSAPHALDSGMLPSLVLAIAGVSGQRAREAWSSLGVDIDDLVGGLIVTGVHPDGWVLPEGSTVTLPPKELAGIRWSGPPTPGEWVFVTENPSVLSAAVEAFGNNDAAVVPRVICTVGTPSRVECASIGALVDTGWRVAVRADFDTKGLEHMRALKKAAPTAQPWRMGAADYLAVAAAGERSLVVSDDASPWDPSLAEAMNEVRAPAFEEDLLAELLSDIRTGRPPAD